MRYEPAFDGLRAVAVTAVVIYHAAAIFQFQYALCPGGWAGVDVFFVLSGYLITRIHLNEQGASGTINLKHFYLRRVLRLMPALACLILFLLPFALLDHDHRPVDLANIAFAIMDLMNWNRAFHWTTQLGGLLGHTWSLSMEEQFYLIWPFTLMVLLRFRKAAPMIILALIIAILSWRSYLVLHGVFRERTYNGFDTHSDSLLLGCFIALLPFDPATLSRQAGKVVIIPLCLFGIILFGFDFNTQLTQSIGISLAAICAGWILLAVSAPGFLTRLLSQRPIVYTGRISYGWYLWHYPFIRLAHNTIPPHFFHQGAIIVPLVASYGVAALSYQFIERPFLKFKRNFKNHKLEEQPVTQYATPHFQN